MKAAALLLAGLLLFGCLQSPSDAFSLEKGLMHYPLNRPVPAFNQTLLESSANGTLFLVTYQSRPIVVYALLRMPNGVLHPPAVVILPGGSIKKEDRQGLASKLTQKGIATLVLDERGNGQTIRLQNWEKDFTLFTKEKEFEEAQMTLDALKGLDVFAGTGVNLNQVAFLGESMGGRYAMVAAVLEPKIKGVVLISSAGFGVPSSDQSQQANFIRSFDPDAFVSQLNKTPVYFFHEVNDDVIPISKARQTFDRASGPKFFQIFDCPLQSHGYCPLLDEPVITTIQQIFSN